MQRTGRSRHAPGEQGKRHGSAARKSTGKRATKSGDSGNGSTRRSDIGKPERAPKTAIRRSRGTRHSQPGGRAFTAA